MRHGVPVYKLVDYDLEPIDRSFYQSELQLISKRDVFNVDKILKRRKRKRDVFNVDKILKRRKRKRDVFNVDKILKRRKRKRDVFNVDKILKRRKRKGVSEVFMSWLGYPRKFNNWIKETDLRDQVE